MLSAGAGFLCGAITGGALSGDGESAMLGKIEQAFKAIQ